MKFIAILLFFCCCLSTSAQIIDTTAIKPPSSKDYRKSSKIKTITGLLALGIGTAVVITSVSHSARLDSVVVETALGALVGAAGVFLLVDAGQDRKKAKKISVGLTAQRLMQDVVHTRYPNYFPAISTRISF